MVPVGGKSDIESGAKVEIKKMIPIYIGEEHKCAFANMANALFELNDLKGAKFFEENMHKDHTTLEHLLNDGRNKYVMNEFMMAAHLLQSVFGYRLSPLRKNNDLNKPVPFGSIKYVTLLPSLDGFKHVIAIVGDRILDSSNRRVLTLCKENLAWCSSKCVEELDACGSMIEKGYYMSAPSRIVKVLQKRKLAEHRQFNDEKETNITFRRPRNTKSTACGKRGSRESRKEEREEEKKKQK